MIKRRFYKQDHGDKSASSSSSSSSESESDSDSTPHVEEEVEEEEIGGGGGGGEEAIGGDDENQEPLLPSPGSGYESEDSSGNDVDGESTGLLVNEEEESLKRGDKNHKNDHLTNEVCLKDCQYENAGKNAPAIDDPTEPDMASYILKCKSVFKCRLCPRIVCLSEETIRVHLKSKRHARSKKLLGEGRLKLMLNSDGELEEDQETHAERYARTMALAQEQDAPKKKDSGRQRQNRRRKKRLRNHSEKKQKPEQPTGNPKKRRMTNTEG
ncbi:uncharacterized protein [Typha angustifolia]|uniref:uncharacterized protein n=1 Tax=Typha angustifolia TaxID=59011 RepID=UPI003C2E68F2